MSFKYRWQRENSPPSEWFDFDRMEKTMNIPNNVTPPFDDWLPDEDEIHTVCPSCGSDDFVYIGECFDDDEYIGSSYDCLECGHSFTMHDHLDE